MAEAIATLQDNNVSLNGTIGSVANGVFDVGVGALGTWGDLPGMFGAGVYYMGDLMVANAALNRFS